MDLSRTFIRFSEQRSSAAWRNEAFQTSHLSAGIFNVGLEIWGFKWSWNELTPGAEGRGWLLTCLTPQIKFSEIRRLALDLLWIPRLVPQSRLGIFFLHFGFSVSLTKHFWISFNIPLSSSLSPLFPGFPSSRCCQSDECGLCGCLSGRRVKLFMQVCRCCAFWTWSAQQMCCFLHRALVWEQVWELEGNSSFNDSLCFFLRVKKKTFSSPQRENMRKNLYNCSWILKNVF